MDASTIIRTLGVPLIKLLGVAESAPKPDEEPRNAWGSKQRELLLVALVERLALHAQKYRNAALGASDAAVEKFARDEFRERATRSWRDRAPITKNISKVVGGWMRRLHRAVEQDAVVVYTKGAVALREGERCIRVYLTFAYPRRILRDRKLSITARFEEVTADEKARDLQFCANPEEPDVTLPEKGQLSPTEARHAEHLFLALRSFGETLDDPDLKEDFKARAESGLRAYVPLSVAKIFVAVFASFIGVTLIASAAEWVSHWINRSKVTPQISTRCTPTPRVVLRFPKPPKDGVHVFRDGREIPGHNGVFVDTHPNLGVQNMYDIHAAFVLIPWIGHVPVTMPDCHPPALPTADVSWDEQRGTFDLTRDRSGRGDPPIALDHFIIEPGHLDSHLEVFTSTCENCDQQTIVYSTLMLVKEPDVKVIVDFGDDSKHVVLLSSKVTRVERGATVTDTPISTPRMFAMTNISGHPGQFYAVTMPHHFKAPGTYRLTVTVYSRAAESDPYSLVKTLKHRVKIGVKPTIEMYESYKLAPQTTSSH
jgi:hypothetical protein